MQSGDVVKRKGCFFNMFIYLKEVWIFCWMCAWTECETDFMWWCLAWRSALTRRLHVANPAHVKHAGGRKTRLQHRSFHNSSVWVEGETWFSDGQPLRAHFNFCNALHDAALVHGVQKKKNAVSVAWKVLTIRLNGQWSPEESWWEPPKQCNFDSFHSPDSLLVLFDPKVGERW